MVAGYSVLLGLTATSVLATLTLTRRYAAESRAESAVFAGVAWAALIALPIYALGLLGLLTAPTLAMSALACHALVFVLAMPKLGWRQNAADTLRLFVSLLRAPFDLVVVATRGRSAALVGVIGATATLLYCAVVTWYAPSFRHWDSLWYHEPIVALTIQNHGFAHTDVPDTLQRVNGYPRMGEMLCLWFVVFTDRRLIELPSVLGAALYLVATYTLARRFGATRTTAAGWATGLLFLPAVFGGLQSAMIDLQLGAFAAAGFALASRRTMRARDAIAVAVVGVLTINTKYLGVVSAFSAAAVAATRLLAANSRVGRGRSAAALALGTALLAAAVGITLIRNHIDYRAPFWPHEFEIKSLHYKSAGWPERGPGGQEGLAEPWSVVLDYLLASPATWAHGDVRDGITNYGLSVPWVLLPCALFALPVGLWQRAAGLVRASTWRRVTPHSWDALRLLGFPLACELLASPATWAARYQYGTLALLVGLAAAACARARVAGEMCIGAFLLLGLITRQWSPDLLVTRTRLGELMHTPYPRREVSSALGAPIVEATGLARERELGPGDLVVTTQYYGNYPALLWNNHFSNRVLFLHATTDFVDEATRLGATWIFLADADPNVAIALAAGWQPVGHVSVSRWGKAYRRP